jgi:hypothetical protein
VPFKDNDMLLEFKLMGFIKEEDSKKQTNFVRIIYFLMEMPPLLNPTCPPYFHVILEILQGQLLLLLSHLLVALRLWIINVNSQKLSMDYILLPHGESLRDFLTAFMMFLKDLRDNGRNVVVVGYRAYEFY